MELGIQTEHFRFSPDILRRLGEELVPEAEHGIIELVKNSYDADASMCRVAFKGEEGGSIQLQVEDDGIGMDAAAVVNGWLLLGKSAKSGSRLTAKGRIPIGNKGLGRLAALRLGRRVHLITRPLSRPHTEYEVVIDWDKFESVTAVEEVPVEVSGRPTDRTHGTTIVIDDIRKPIGLREMQRLGRGLLLFADPFSHREQFRPILDAPGFRQLELMVSKAYFDDADYHLIAELDSDGKTNARVVDFSGKELWSTSGPDELGPGTYKTAPLEFQLWTFILGRGRFSSRDASITEVRNWLRHVGGVHVYRRNVRVAPYGSPDEDWLGMNLARVRQPEERPSTNNSIGFVRTEDPQDVLFEKTDRTGFVHDNAFLEARRFCIDALDWMANRRMELAERKRSKSRVEAAPAIEKSLAELRAQIARLPENARVPINEDLLRLQRAQENEKASLQAEIQLYRSVASVGTFTAAFAHESRKPVDQIDHMLDTFERRGQRAYGAEFATLMARPINVARAAVGALKGFASVPLRLMQRDRRRIGRVDIDSAIQEIFNVYKWHLSRERVDFELLLHAKSGYVLGSEAAIESILSNFITNSITALNRPDADGARKIRVWTEIVDDSIRIVFADSGPGISGIDAASIWLPGRTTTPNGTGIGLTIVRDTVQDLGGQCSASPTSDLGGARFTVELPLVSAQR